MNQLKILERLGAPGIFDIAKSLHYYFPKISTKRINDIILQLDSIDQAVIVLCGNKDDNLDIDRSVYMILKYRDEQEKKT